MTASVPFPNRAIIVECLVVTVLVEDADGRGGGRVWCVFVSVSVCVCRREGRLVLENKEQHRLCCPADSLLALSISRQ